MDKAPSEARRLIHLFNRSSNQWLNNPLIFVKHAVMKMIVRFILILFALCTLHFASFAEDASNWGIQQPEVKQIPNEASEKTWEKEQNEKLYENYGSQDSPGFLNREDIDPATSDFEEKYDYQDDAPYNYDAGGN